mgnify:CR=1 FL=1|tara:strand:+ start:1964 stop:2593 length:630 start_codon:yes stop_codon:yes gene_type:complete
MNKIGPYFDGSMVDFETSRVPEYIVIPDVLTEKECAGLIRYGTKHGKYTQGKVGSEIGGSLDKSIRDTHLYWFHHDKLANKVADKIYDVNQKVFQNRLTHCEFFQLGVYNPDGHYGWHRDDIELLGKSSARKLSFTILLNDTCQYKGGDFQVHSRFDAVTGSPIVKTVSKLKHTGSMVVFPSRTYHRVKPVIEGQRISLVGWCWGPRLT